MRTASVLVLLEVAVVCGVLLSCAEARGGGVGDASYVQGPVVRTRTDIAGATVEYDAAGVPFITGDSEFSLFFAQGRVMAEERLYVMDFYRRLMKGELAEVFGEGFLGTDTNSKRVQWLDVCQQNLDAANPASLSVFQHYLAGVNSFLEDLQSGATNATLPPEFSDYDIPFPAPFTEIDQCLTLKALALGLSGNAKSERTYSSMLSMTSPERFMQYQQRDPQQPTIIPPYSHSTYNGTNKRGVLLEHELPHHPIPKALVDTARVVHEASGAEDSNLAQLLDYFRPEELTRASNNWAVHGNHTVTGMPLVCNDPHLSYTAPIVWYMVGLYCTDTSSPWNQHIVGVTVPLAPGVGIGRNDYLAWGYTMVQADAQDVFVMQNNEDNTQYYHNGEWLDYTFGTTTVVVKDQGEVTVDLINSHYGPVVADGDTYYSLMWTALAPTDPSFQALIGSNVAKNLEEFQDAVYNWWALCFNAAYGDVEGNILYQTTGGIPIRVPGDEGMIPKPGTGEWDWLGYLSNEQKPTVINPPQGFVVSANNPVGYREQLPQHFVGYNAPGFRAQRIIDRLIDELDITDGVAANLLDVEDMASIQGDVSTLFSPYLYPALEKLILTDATAKQVHQQLLHWNTQEGVDSTEAPVFERWVDCLYDVTTYEIGRSYSNSFLMAKIFNNATESGEGDDPSCAYWGVTCLQYASTCFEDVVDFYTGDGSALPKYGSVHEAFFYHLMPLPVRYNRFVEVGGSEYTPNAAYSASEVPGPVTAGPSMRFIADMSNTRPTKLILPLGESGDPTSPYYSNMLETWAAVEYLNVDWGRQPVKP